MCTSEAIVYIVDDDELIRRALSRLARSAGLRAETFKSARAFLDHALPDRPACLVLDIRLPGQSGLELQAKLTQAQKDIPIIFITGYADVRTTVRALRGGAADFLEKPFDDQELLDCILRALSVSRARRADRAETRELEGRVARLTPRERTVLQGVMAGRLNKQIASSLAIAEKTVKVHRGNLMRKMQAGSVADLVRMTQMLRNLLSPRSRPCHSSLNRPAVIGQAHRGLHAGLGHTGGDREPG